MATLTPTAIAITGTTQTLAAAAVGGDKFANDGLVMLVVTNGSGGSINVTIAAQYLNETAPPGYVKTSPAIAVAAGATKMIGPFVKKAFNDADGNVNVSYSSATTVTVGVFRLTPAA